MWPFDHFTSWFGAAPASPPPPPPPPPRATATSNLPPAIQNGAGANNLVRFQIESDWHLEQAQFFDLEYRVFRANFPAPQPGDILLLAGDCGRVNLGTARAANGSLSEFDYFAAYQRVLQEDFAPTYRHVFLIGGNNEPKTLPLGPILEESIVKLKSMENAIPNLTVLENQSADLSGLGHDITILGCTLWSRIREDAAPASGDAGTWTGETNAAHNERFERSYQWLKDEVARVRRERPTHRIIIMTHHAPTIRESGQPGRDGTRAEGLVPAQPEQWSGYQTDILGGEGLVGLRPGDHWVFGHTHFSTQFEQDEVRCISNQRGGPSNDSKLRATRYRKGGVVVEI
ncbi:uncharacterized protein LY89DRAFT_686104 [Mollisia scopiformis]|uniref:Calcineurin-like phosphoesterase domain-containing protein n=1 Tax=Mollisia scopiformis TaxID=149040 RepID=A0A194X586_MOLSC|nr:uncharacterized protein LY89DRAFT_686104 [Mollisia scopiformis]KUJ15343.1 hypothetical protein LY89DRAFT_686104 [Mollisia scopiformis]